MKRSGVGCSHFGWISELFRFLTPYVFPSWQLLAKTQEVTGTARTQ